MKDPKPAKGKAGGLAIRPFIVAMSWIEIEVSILAADSDYLSGQTHRVIRNYGRDVADIALAVAMVLDAGEEGMYSPQEVFLYTRDRLGESAVFHESYRGHKVRPIRIAMEAWRWKNVEQVAKYFDCNPSAIVRAALVKRKKGLVRLHERSAA